MKMNQKLVTPKQLGYHFPAEFEPHEATWLSWPHKEASWPGKIETIYQPYAKFIKALAENEKVRININNEAMRSFAADALVKENVNMRQVEFFFHPTNDAWCRDHGPAFIVNPEKKGRLNDAVGQEKAIINWKYNAWGNKYPPYDLDDVIPTLIANYYNLPVFNPNIVMEGGSVEFNGKGTLITSRSCLLNPNRNPQLNQQQIEFYLSEYYGAEQILWIDEGIEGDDTDGHIDDTVRFVSEDTVLAAAEKNKEDENYKPLKKNLQQLKKMRLLNGKQLNIIELPMPDEVFYEGERLPASYANFYIANNVVIVPLYNCNNDDIALEIIQECFKTRKVIGINSVDIIWGLGSFHCLSQQEPMV